MEPEEFIEMAKFEIYNYAVDYTNGQNLSVSDVRLLRTGMFFDELKVVMDLPKVPEYLFSVTHNRATRQTRVNVYKIVETFEPTV